MGNRNPSERKKDHIELALESVVKQQDGRFYYEPVLSAHPHTEPPEMHFAGKVMRVPVWVSSMTGGTKEAGNINRNLARACNEFGMGMGLGSCRIILRDDTYLRDFQVRNLMSNAPLYANLGIAQIEELVDSSELHLIDELIAKTDADGLIVHVNPLQEWLQPEGDRFKNPPIDTIKRLLDKDYKIIVKEVGQGFGPDSLKALMQLPLAAIDFGAHGGTNFSKLEMIRRKDVDNRVYDSISKWGHSALEMVEFYNTLNEELADNNMHADVIISGGVSNFTDGYYLTEKINANAVYGQASAFLEHARGAYEELQHYVSGEVEGLKLARAFLRVR